MKLLELVKYFRDGGSFEEFCKEQSLDQDAEVVEIYMKQSLSINNDIAFFEIEKTEGNYEYFDNEDKYFNLFDFYYFLDAIEDSNNVENIPLTDEQITKLLYDYAVNDA